jgi:hypothetical protein
VETVLRPIERKVLGALLILCNQGMEAKASTTEIANTMGYKQAGGAITTAIYALEIKNFLSVIERGVYKILI